MRNPILFLQFLTILHLIKIIPTKQENYSDSSRRLLQAKPHVAITNKAKKAVMVHCHSKTHDYVKEMVKAGESVRWEFQDEEKEMQDMPMACYVDLRNQKHGHGYFSGFQKKKCSQCDWNILSEKVELCLKNGKWEKQALVPDEEVLDDFKKDE